MRIRECTCKNQFRASARLNLSPEIDFYAFYTSTTHGHDDSSITEFQGRAPAHAHAQNLNAFQ